MAAAESGAEQLGLVFALSRRGVTPDGARSIIEAVRQIKTGPLFTGVFVNAPVVEVNRLAAYCGLDRVQLSGDESWEYCREIERPVVKVFHVTASRSAQDILFEIEQGRKVLKREFFCLLDTHEENKYGGTGQTFNWEVAGEVAARCPVYVAGGLTPQNVGELVRTVRPAGVDVSSGVETNGCKDADKIKAFIEAVRRSTK